MRLVAIYLTVDLASSILMMVIGRLMGRNSVWVGNLYTGSLALLLYAMAGYLSPTKGRILRGSACLALLGWMMLLAWGGGSLMRFHPIGLSLWSLLMQMAGILLILQIFQSESPKPFDQPGFWIGIGVASYFGVSVIYFSAILLLSRDYYLIFLTLGIVHNLMNALANLMI